MSRITWADIVPDEYSGAQGTIFGSIISPVLRDYSDSDSDLETLIRNTPAAPHAGARTLYSRIEKICGGASGNADRSQFYNAPAGASPGTPRIIARIFMLARPVTDMYSFGSFYFWQEFKKKWLKFLPAFPFNYENFRKKIIVLTERLPNTGRISSDTFARFRDRIRNAQPDAEKAELSSLLATLSIIASTWLLWENYEHPKYAEDPGLVDSLYSLIFPNENADAEDMLDAETELFSSADDQAVRELLRDAHTACKSSDFSTAGAYAETVIFTYHFAPDYLLGEAYNILGDCKRQGYQAAHTSIQRYTASDFYKEAANRGVIKQTIEPDKIIPDIKHADFKRPGNCYVNEDNAIYQYILKAYPDGPRGEKNPDGWNYEVCDFSAYWFSPSDEMQWFLLISDDYEKNISDALTLLNDISAADSIDLTKIEIFVRCSEEDAAQITDTALSYFPMDDSDDDDGAQSVDLGKLHIHLIDDAKRSAELLLSKHPAFYFDSAQFKTEADTESKSIQLVIVSDNQDDRLTSWLVRDAFWMLAGAARTGAQPARILVLSPNAGEQEKELCLNCPGLAQFTKYGRTHIDGINPRDRIEINDIIFPYIEYKPVAAGELAKVLDEICENKYKIGVNDDTISTYPAYFVVDSNSDLSAIKLAAKIREISTRHDARSRGDFAKSAMKRPAIAVHCTSYINASVASKLIVPKEDSHGNQWFNSYGFIPFGTIEELYGWKNIGGGLIEEAAQRMHIGWYESDTARDKKLQKYFYRLYNHDSSFSEALGLPYKLHAVGIDPNPWYLGDPDSFWSPSAMKELSEELKAKITNNPSTIETLAKVEHVRWCCYMLSTGWLPMTDADTIKIIKAGSSRHVLQIAKLHPCICSWEHLSELQSQLHYAYCNGNTDSDYSGPYNENFKDYYSEERIFNKFPSYDIEGAEIIPDILSREPLLKQKPAQKAPDIQR